jgi:diguanylate cyclase (GGDEF)-like protein
LPIIGWLRLAGQRAGWYDTELGVALMVVLAATLIVAATMRLAWTLDHAHRQRLHAEMRALTDELTGLPNRRLVEIELARLDDAAVRHGRPYSVLAIDADGLKRINDTYGHGFGDLALRRLAGAMTEALRTADIVARVGGDEFTALLPETDAAHARLIADRLREALQRPGGADGAPTLTASIGISTWSPGWNGHDVVADADRALYEAKVQRGLAWSNS